MQTVIRIAALLSFSLCLTGGLWILGNVAFSDKGDALGVGLGFYFVGKSFFVGPMLWIAAGRFERGTLEADPL